jgi:uncharacterized protein YkwD
VPAAGTVLAVVVGAVAVVATLWALRPGVVSTGKPPSAPLYASDDPWRGYLADEQTCPGGEDPSRAVADQADTMICLVNYARAHAGLGALVVSPTLSESARLKGEEILRCGTFAHSPCGDDPSADVRRLGYQGSFGENLYVADGRSGAPRVALDQWLNSPGHRENLLRPDWRVQSIYVVKVARFGNYRGATLWVSHFGDR